MNIKELRKRTETYPNELPMLIEDAFGGWGFTKAGGEITLASINAKGGITVHMRHPDTVLKGTDGQHLTSHTSLEQSLNDDNTTPHTASYKARMMIHELYGIPFENVSIKWKVLKPRK